VCCLDPHYLPEAVINEEDTKEKGENGDEEAQSGVCSLRDHARENVHCYVSSSFGHLTRTDKDHPDHHVADQFLRPEDGMQEHIAHDHIDEKEKAGEDNTPSQKGFLQPGKLFVDPFNG